MADTKTFDIPKNCKAGVVVNEGPDFTLKVEDVPVPEPSKRIISTYTVQS
jgi:propanol-preferring alcohol dehydrogenase